MAYPIVSAPYGFKPVNLIGGQVFAGSTRNVPIQYGYGTNIFYGDVVSMVQGFATRQVLSTGATVPTGAVNAGIIGVFLGCSFTDPVTKQKRFSQFWPASTLAGDAVAVVADDPDTLYQCAVVTAQAGITIGSAALCMVGQNLQGSDYVATNGTGGNINTGNSYGAALPSSAGTLIGSPVYPLRVVEVVRSTANPLGTATYTSGTTTLVTSPLPNALPIGTDVAFLAANGQLVQTGAYVTTAASAGATSVVINVQYKTMNAGGTAATNATIPANSTLVFTQYPEIIVKLNFGQHEYYGATPF